jgi:molybdopterin molybdotransferase
MADGLLAVAEAQARLLDLAGHLTVETVPLLAAAGRWVAADIAALRTQPTSDLSAMDGYAIRFAELPGPWTVVGESAAGDGLGRALEPGEAARIFTGAPLPGGADTILVQEEAARQGDELRLAGEGPARHGQNVRPAGSDFAIGTRIVVAGERLTPARIALAAIGGHGSLPVHRKPRIILISTGNELVLPGDPIADFQLPASNGPMLAALLASQPVETEDRGIVRDDLDALSAAFRDAASVADIIVTTGGASVGDHDLVRPALEKAGAALDFWRVAMKPGKPLMAGTLGNAITLGLPGNPVSAFVTARIFLLPLIAHMLGAARPIPSARAAMLDGILPRAGKRAEYVRAVRTEKGVRPLTNQDSGALLALASADVLIVRKPDSPEIRAGEQVDILDLA